MRYYNHRLEHGDYATMDHALQDALFSMRSMPTALGTASIETYTVESVYGPDESPDYRTVVARIRFGDTVKTAQASLDYYETADEFCIKATADGHEVTSCRPMADADVMAELVTSEARRTMIRAMKLMADSIRDQ